MLLLAASCYKNAMAVDIRQSLVMSALVLTLIGCGSNNAADPGGGATPSQSSTASNVSGALTPTLRSTIATTLKIDESRVTPNASFQKDLGADDLSMVELVMAYEREFKVDIRDSDADQFKQVQDVVNYLRKKNALR